MPKVQKVRFSRNDRRPKSDKDYDKLHYSKKMVKRGRKILWQVKEIDIEVNLNIDEINYKEPADLDQELFDKIYGKGIIKSVTELKKKISNDIEKQFVNQTDQKLMNS